MNWSLLCIYQSYMVSCCDIYTSVSSFPCGLSWHYLLWMGPLSKCILVKTLWFQYVFQKFENFVITVNYASFSFFWGKWFSKAVVADNSLIDYLSTSHTLAAWQIWPKILKYVIFRWCCPRRKFSYNNIKG